MSLFSNLFSNKNSIEIFAEELANSENKHKNQLFEALELAHIDTSKLSLNREKVLSFVVANILFILETNPRHKGVKFNREIEIFLNKEREKESCKISSILF